MSNKISRINFTKQEIISQIKEKFYNLSKLPEESVIEEFENKIDTYHQSNEIDEQLIIFEALMLLIPPVSDYLKSLKLLQKIKSEKSTVLTAIIQFQNMGFIEERVIDLLRDLCKFTDDFDKKSIYFYILSLTSIDKKENLLIKSIKFNPETSLSYIDLAILYLKSGEKTKSIWNFAKGLSNTIVLDKNTPKNWIDYDFFIAENIKGTLMSSELYAYYEELKQKAQGVK